MAILNQDEARRILEKVIAFSKAEDCQASLNGNVGGNIRYARNSVSTAGEVNDSNLAVTSSFGKRSGTATINEFDDASLEKVVRRAEEMAKLAPENPEAMPLLGPQQYLTVDAWSNATANITPDQRAEIARKSMEAASAKGVAAAGFLEDGVFFQAMMNSKGLFAYHRGANVDFTVTMRTADGTGSGYAIRDYNDVSKLDSAAVSAIAVDKAVKSQKAVAIEPGKYTVILEPAATVELLGNMFFSMDARQADEGRSFLSKKGGGTKVGEKIFDERITFYSDPTHPEIPTSPWAGDGRPQEKVTWVEKGVVKNLYTSRFWAQKMGYKAIPTPGGVVMMAGDDTLENMIKTTPKGILVTRLWYIRAVDPQTLLYTGLTRDGTFYIENGKIKHAVKNFRFNESPVIMLNNLESLGRPQRINGNLVPPMKIRDFTFTSLSDAV